MVRGLFLLNQWRDNLIQPLQFFFRVSDSRTGFGQLGAVCLLSLLSNIKMLLHCAFIALSATITDIRRFRVPPANCGFILLAFTVAHAAATTQFVLPWRIANHADVFFGAGESLCTVVVVPPRHVGTPKHNVLADFLRDTGRRLPNNLRDLLEVLLLIQKRLNHLPFFQRVMREFHHDHIPAI